PLVSLTTSATVHTSTLSLHDALPILAGHLAGIRHYRGDEFVSRTRYADVRSGLAVFQDDSLLVEPGTRYLYSSYGWNLLSAVVEDRKGTRLNSSHVKISYAVFCLKKK